jgi:FdhD protein
MRAEVREVARDGSIRPATREWVPEVPVALEYNGLSYAVMMATPADLEDFARGFALTEGLARSVADVGDIAVAEVAAGWIVRTQLSGLGIDKLTERVRARVAESSCGLCGIENIEAVAVPLPQVAPHDPVPAETVFAAVAALRNRQALNQRTGAAHAAAFADLSGEVLLLREDVGRHNAMDKLVGALAAAGIDPARGLFVSTARCSYEIVEKVVRARQWSERPCGLSLHCLAREDSFLAL